MEARATEDINLWNGCRYDPDSQPENKLRSAYAKALFPRCYETAVPLKSTCCVVILSKNYSSTFITAFCIRSPKECSNMLFSAWCDMATDITAWVVQYQSSKSQWPEVKITSSGLLFVTVRLDILSVAAPTSTACSWNQWMEGKYAQNV